MKKNLKKVLAVFVVSCLASTLLVLPSFAANTSNYQYWYTQVYSDFTNIANKKKVTTDNYSTASFWTGGGLLPSEMKAQCYYNGKACSSAVTLPKNNKQVQIVYTSTVKKGQAIIIKAKTSNSYMADGYHDVH